MYVMNYATGNPKMPGQGDGKHLTVCFFNGEPGFWNQTPNVWCWDAGGGEYHRSNGSDDSYLIVLRGHSRATLAGPPGNLSDWNRGPSYGIKVGPYKNDDAVLIFWVEDRLDYVHWTSVQHKWQGQADAKKPYSQKIDNCIATLQGMLQTLVNALGTGLAAAGPEFAMPAGAVLGVGGLLLMAFGANQPKEPDPPPNLNEIVEAVREVLRRSLINTTRPITRPIS
jgi:hypothetical protein